MNNYDPIILDLKGLVMNSFHASMSSEPLRGEVKDSINTAEHGFTTFLTKFFDPMLGIVKSPLHLIAALDSGNAYRRGVYPNYKSGRRDKRPLQDPLELEQIDKALALAKQFLSALGVPLVSLKGQEADDVIAFLSDKLAATDKVTVATIDRDLLAITSAYGIFRNGELQTQYSLTVPNNLIPLYSSIVGKGSDYPGVPGLGEKAWESMVQDYGLDGMEELQQLMVDKEKDRIKSVAGAGHNLALKKAAAYYPEWSVQFDIARLHPELCEGANVNLEWHKRCPTVERLHKALENAGALDLFGQYSQFCYTQTLVTLENFQDFFTQFKSYLSDSPCVPFDYETYDPIKNPNYTQAAKGRTYVDVLNSKIAGCSFAVGNNLQHVFYLPVAHKDTDNLPESVVLDFIRLAESCGKELVSQNSQFEGTVTQVQLGHLIDSFTDTRVLAHHLDENSETGLKYLSKRYLNYDQVTYQGVLDSVQVEGRLAVDMRDLSGEDVLSYGCDDSLVTGHLYALFGLMTKLEGTYAFIKKHSCPALAPLTSAYIHGTKIDLQELERQKQEDLICMEENQAKVLALLERHCTEPDYKAIDNLYQDQQAYVRFKARKGRLNKDPKAEYSAVEGAVKRALESYRTVLKKNSVYIKPYTEKVVQEFTPTAARLSKVAVHLGLPPIEKVTKAYLSDYISDRSFKPLDETQKLFIDLMAPAVDGFSKREGQAYGAFKELCQKISLSFAPTIPLGTDLNLDSPTQKVFLYYLLLGLPIRIRTKVQPDSLRREAGLPGSPSTDDTALDFALANDCEGLNEWKKEVLESLSKYAKARTRMSNYWTPYPLWAGDDGVVHPNFIFPGTKTRRPTCVSPNLLQVSKGVVRRIVVPRDPSNVIVSVDCSSQELRVMAALTGDKNFLSAYIHPANEKDKDLHIMTGCGIAPALAKRAKGDLLAQLKLDPDGKVNYAWYNTDAIRGAVSVAEFLSRVRRTAKVVNFGAAYGGTASTVATQAMIPIEDAELAVNGMLSTYPGIGVWKARVLKFARKHGYVSTTYGGRRHCGNALRVGSGSEVGRWERQLCNFKIQGQCGELLAAILSGMQETDLLGRLDSYLLTIPYDEIVAEVPKRHVHEYLHSLADLIEIKMPGIQVPMVADCSFGPTWYDQVEVGVRPSKEKVQEVLDSFEKPQQRVA